MEFVIMVIMTLRGIVMLIMSMGFGRYAVKHPHYRLLGGFMVTVFPAMMLCAMVYGFVLGLLQSAGVKVNDVDGNDWVMKLINWTLVVVYIAVTLWWSSNIKLRAQAEAASPTSLGTPDAEMEREADLDPADPAV